MTGERRPDPRSVGAELRVLQAVLDRLGSVDDVRSVSKREIAEAAGVSPQFLSVKVDPYRLVERFGRVPWSVADCHMRWGFYDEHADSHAGDQGWTLPLTTESAIGFYQSAARNALTQLISRRASGTVPWGPADTSPKSMHDSSEPVSVVQVAKLLAAALQATSRFGDPDPTVAARRATQLWTDWVARLNDRDTVLISGIAVAADLDGALSGVLGYCAGADPTQAVERWVPATGVGDLRKLVSHEWAIQVEPVTAEIWERRWEVAVATGAAAAGIVDRLDDALIRLRESRPAGVTARQYADIVEEVVAGYWYSSTNANDRRQTLSALQLVFDHLDQAADEGPVAARLAQIGAWAEQDWEYLTTLSEPMLEPAQWRADPFGVGLQYDALRHTRPIRELVALADRQATDLVDQAAQVFRHPGLARQIKAAAADPVRGQRSYTSTDAIPELNRLLSAARLGHTIDSRVLEAAFATIRHAFAAQAETGPGEEPHQSSGAGSHTKTVLAVRDMSSSAPKPTPNFWGMALAMQLLNEVERSPGGRLLEANWLQEKTNRPPTKAASHDPTQGNRAQGKGH